MKWHEWRGNKTPAMWIKRLFDRFGIRVDLHKVVAADDAECFHTHPSYCFRLILWGGYLEELEGGRKVKWLPGSFGIVPPSLCHRFDAVLNGKASYSFWIRFRPFAKVELRGSGWPKNAVTQSTSK